MSSVKVDDILEEIDDVLDAAWVMPLSGGKVVCDAEKIRKLIDAIRGNMPAEIRKATAIVQDRASIIDSAKEEAEDIIRKAEERRNLILSHEEIVMRAEERANEIQTQTQKRAREMKKSAQDFAEDVLRQAEETLASQMGQVRQARQSLRNGHSKAADPSDETV